MAPERLPDPLAVALDIAGILEQLRIGYVAAGSLASSFHGEPRSTNDVDFVVDLTPGQVAEFVAALGNRYYVSADAATDAARNGGAFNLIQYATAVKVDLFVAGDDPFDAERLAARTRERIGATDRETVYMDTAEHTILRKLEWYRRGGEVSERQWRDVIGIIRSQAGGLDWHRLRSWAPRLGVADLLERAHREGAPAAEG
ncbi:MAG TPA: hypothetical protein VGA37_05490 [Gemmatimonadales bacterium]